MLSSFLSWWRGETSPGASLLGWRTNSQDSGEPGRRPSTCSEPTPASAGMEAASRPTAPTIAEMAAAPDGTAETVTGAGLTVSSRPPVRYASSCTARDSRSDYSSRFGISSQ